MQRLPVVAAAGDRLSAAQQTQQAVKVLLTDDPAVVGILQRLLSELDDDLPFQLLHQRVLHRTLTQDIVRGHAGLTAVEVLPKDDPSGGKPQIGGLIHDAGALAPQLQNGGGQRLGGVPQHLPAHSLTAGKEHQIELFRQKRAVLLPSAGDHGHMGGVEGLADEPFDHRAGGGGVGAGLDHGGVAGGDGVGQGVDGQQEGVVPGAHNQHVPAGGGERKAPGGELGQRRMDRPGSGQRAQMLPHVADLRLHQSGLAHKSLEGALAQIRGQGGGNLILVLLHGGIQPPQSRLTEGEGQGGPAAEEGPLAL